ncbi:MAG: ATP-binding protein [Spirochaetales bacterium]|nr:ATP-binding protein [Spirochaetales bacterium]
MILLLIFSVLNVVFAETTDILVLYSFNADLPWTKGFQLGIDAEKKERGPGAVFHLEYMESMRMPDSLTNDQWAEYLYSKYVNSGIDMIIADSDNAVRFVETFPELLGKIPQILYAMNTANVQPYQYSLVPQVKTAVLSTVGIAVNQNPGLERAIVINGNNASSNGILHFLLPELEKRNIEAEIISDYSLDSLRNRLASEDPALVAFYTLVFSDKDGNNYVPKAFLQEITAVSRIPLYTFWSSLMGSGAVGGTMIDAKTTAREMIRAGFDYLEFGEFADEYSTTRTFLDWKAMRRNRIKAADTGGEPEIINIPQSVFIVYYREIITVVSAVIFILLLITSILLRRNRITTRILIQKDKSLNRLLETKDILMHEMNHRIKNNLLILQSLISLQIGEMDDSKSKGYLEDVYGRLGTLALVHEKLYSTGGDTDDFAIDEYITSLVKQIYKGLAIDQAAVKLETAVENIQISVKKAISCGLIINELLSNAIKYAFPGAQAESPGRIFIGFSANSSGLIELTVKDSGTGIPENKDFFENAGFGLKIVKALVEQLKGTLAIDRKNGTEIKITFAP